MRLETINEPLFLKLEEAIAYSPWWLFVPTMQRGPAAPSYACMDVRCARRIGAFRPIGRADIGASQAHDATPRGYLLKQ